MTHTDAVKSIWQHLGNGLSDERAQVKEIIRYATLAPSGHNTQPWRFRIDGQSIAIHPDLSRRTPVVDPDDHHLFVSLGCAVENLLQAARAFGFSGDAVFDPSSGGFITVMLEHSRAERSPLFEAIPNRQCTRSDYDGGALDATELRLLEAAGTRRGAAVVLLTARAPVERVLEYVVRGNAIQTCAPAFVDELEDWIRFNDDEAMQTCDGLAARSLGIPPAPRWLGRLLFRAFFRANPERRKLVRQVRSSAGIAVFVSDTDDGRSWVEAGRCYERFALQATVLGIRNAFVNQPSRNLISAPSWPRRWGWATCDLISSYVSGVDLQCRNHCGGQWNRY